MSRGVWRQEEFRTAWKALKGDAYDDAEYEAEWAKIDADGDGNLTVTELASFYGFDYETGGTNEMTDEQILQALAMQAAVDEMNAAAGKKKEEKAGTDKKERDATVKRINIDPKKKKKTYDDPKEELAVEFLELGHLSDVWKPEGHEDNSLDRMISNFAEKPFYIRSQDENNETILHKL